jgi:replicative DNA helicase
LLLHREKEARETECRVAKNREGREGTVTLLFRPEWVGFDERTREEDTDESEDRRYGS